jgi:hypothetical protein
MTDEFEDVPLGMEEQRKEIFTKKVLEEQDGKKLPLTLENGGPVIGEATLHYDAEAKALKADFRIDDPLVEDFLRQSDDPGKFIGEAD